jgi:hypothetical protein
MGKVVEIHLAGQAKYVVEVDGIEIRVHKGSPPGDSTGSPRASIRDVDGEPHVKDGAKNGDDAVKVEGVFHEPGDLRPPLNARRVERKLEAGE